MLVNDRGGPRDGIGRVAQPFGFRPQSGRIEARIGLRMMPTFPRSSLSFRTAGFPRYGWKVGLSDGAFPDVTQLKSAPDIRCITAGLHPPFVHLVVLQFSRSESGNADSIMHRHGGWVVLRPRGLSWSRLSEQLFRVDKWSVCRG